MVVFKLLNKLSKTGFDYAQPDRQSESLSADKAGSQTAGQIECNIFYLREAPLLQIFILEGSHDKNFHVCQI